MAAVDAAVGVEGVDEALLAAVGGPGFQAVTGFLLGTGVSRDTRGQVVEESWHGRRSAVGIGYGWVGVKATVDARIGAVGMGLRRGRRIHPWHEENPLCDWTACGYVSGPLAGIWLRLWANPRTLTELR